MVVVMLLVVVVLPPQPARARPLNEKAKTRLRVRLAARSFERRRERRRDRTRSAPAREAGRGSRLQGDEGRGESEAVPTPGRTAPAAVQVAELVYRV